MFRCLDQSNHTSHNLVGYVTFKEHPAFLSQRLLANITSFGASYKPCDRSSRKPQKLLASTQNLRYIYSYIKKKPPPPTAYRTLYKRFNWRAMASGITQNNFLGSDYMRNSQFIGISISEGLSCGGARISVELRKEVCIVKAKHVYKITNHPHPPAEKKLCETTTRENRQRPPQENHKHNATPKCKFPTSTQSNSTDVSQPTSSRLPSPSTFSPPPLYYFPPPSGSAPP